MRFKKGSAAARAYMAKIRGMRKKVSYSRAARSEVKDMARHRRRSRIRGRTRRFYAKPRTALQPKHFIIGMAAAVPVEALVDTYAAKYLSRFGEIGGIIDDVAKVVGGLYGYAKLKNPYLKGFALAMCGLGTRNITSYGLGKLITSKTASISNGSGGVVVG